MGAILNFEHPKVKTYRTIDDLARTLVQRPSGRAEKWEWQIQNLPIAFQEVIVSDYDAFLNGWITEETFSLYLNRLYSFLRSRINVGTREMPDFKKYSDYADIGLEEARAIRSGSLPLGYIHQG
jgi:hypothetical protein